MKDSVWIYIKDTIIFPFIFIAETSFIPFSKSNKTKSKRKYTKKK
uniref:Uncharacterized protein n=1 Tax=viral metagenome TaxID=1070528 RepID=A0A6C0DP07_9ZZZZ